MLLRRLREFRIRHALIAERLTSLTEVSVDYFLRQVELRLPPLRGALNRASNWPRTKCTL